MSLKFDFFVNIFVTYLEFINFKPFIFKSEAKKFKIFA